MNHTYEIEIKSLLGGKEKADELVNKMGAKDPGLKILSSHRQLNHYFIDGDLKIFQKKLDQHIEPQKKLEFETICKQANNYSIRTRLADSRLILVIKGSLNDHSSANGVIRMEFESDIQGLSLEELDKLILDCGFKYQAKWSRERQSFRYKNIDVTVDKNAGYGYLAEFEKQINEQTLADQTKKELENIMTELGVSELPQDRLERMFKFYNDNWQDYYGTDKFFTIE